jgi:hypothetical protein
MIHLLRHVSVCLWIALTIGGFASLWLLPLLQPALGMDAAPLLVAGLLAVLFTALVWAVDRLGRRRAYHWMQAADRAEREGRCTEAETAYRQALDLLDGFGVSPRTRRRLLWPLAGRAARFYLSQSRLSAAGEDFVTAYLGAHPRDEEVAEQWVQQAARQGGLRDEHQEVADRIGKAHPRNAAIQREVARLYLALERTDYPALQAYRRVCAEAGPLPPEFGSGLARLLQRDGRSDGWIPSLRPPAEAAASTPAGIPGGRPPEPPPIGDDSWGTSDRPQALEDEDEDFRVSAEGDVLDAEEEEARPSLLAGPHRGPSRWSRLMERCSAARQSVRGALQRLEEGRARWRPGPIPVRGLRRAGALFLLAGIAGGGIWMAAYVSERFAPQPTEPSVADAPPASTPPPADLFTLQVAAHLKQEYALKLVEELKKKGLDAYWIETVSGGKTWYQVRIAHFPDQPSAREYGRNLKWKGVIDDFYVTAYSR